MTLQSTAVGDGKHAQPLTKVYRMMRLLQLSPSRVRGRAIEANTNLTCQSMGAATGVLARETIGREKHGRAGAGATGTGGSKSGAQRRIMQGVGRGSKAR